jgi:hypothetical protein
MHGFAVKIVAFMICEELRISVAMFPASQREPTLAQVERMFRTCSRPDYPGFTSVDVISWFPATEPQPS